MLFVEFLLIELNAAFDKGKAPGHDAIVQDSDFSGGGLECVEKSFAGFHPSVEGGKCSMLAGGNRESGFAENLSGTRVVFDALA